MKGKGKGEYEDIARGRNGPIEVVARALQLKDSWAPEDNSSDTGRPRARGTVNTPAMQQCNRIFQMESHFL